MTPGRMRLPMLGELDKDDIADLLEAAEDLERQLDAEPGAVIRNLSALIRRQSDFLQLKETFGALPQAVHTPIR